MTAGLALAATAALVVVNACFVAAEFSIVSVRRTPVEALAKVGSRRARTLLRVLDELDAHISAGQIMITAAGIGIGWLGAPAAAQLLGPFVDKFAIGDGTLLRGLSLTMSFAAVTLATLIAGEITPKLLGLRRAQTVALWMALPLRTLALLSKPLLRLFTAASSALLSLFGVRSEDHRPELDTLGPDELRSFVKQSSTFGRLSFTRRKMIEKAIEFADHTAKQIMVPRDQIDFVNLEDSLEENLAVLHEAGHTRYPLTQGTLDTVVGMIHIKDLFRRNGSLQSSDELRALQREMLIVPESQPIDVLQRTFQRKRAHMAIVVDEYGVPTGLVTLEDVLEELVGEIRDEFDQDEKAKIVHSKEGVFIDGMLLVEDLCRELNIDLEESADDTVGGYITTQLGKIARVGDSFKFADYEGSVVEMEGRRIARVVLSGGALDRNLKQQAF